jgi:hypothetical protein
MTASYIYIYINRKVYIHVFDKLKWWGKKGDWVQMYDIILSTEYNFISPKSIGMMYIFLYNSKHYEIVFVC